MPLADTSLLQDPQRLGALAETGLLDSTEVVQFDVCTSLAARLLGVPIALVTLIASDHQFRLSQQDHTGGEPEPRRNPLSRSFCQHVVAGRERLVIRDSLTHPAVQDLACASEYRAYVGVPLILSGGQAVGALCAIDLSPRDWSEDAVGILEALATGVVSELELRVELGRRARLQHELEQRIAVDELLLQASLQLIGPQRASRRALLNGVLSSAASIFGVKGATFILREGHAAAPEVYRSADGTGAASIEAWLMGLLVDGEVVSVPDAAAVPPTAGGDPMLLRDALRDSGIRALVAAPAIGGNDSSAVLLLESGEACEWPPRTVQLVRRLADALCGAMNRARAERALSEAQIRNAAILQAALDAVVTIDSNGLVVDFNPAAEVMFGYTAEAVVGQSMSSLIIPPHLRAAHRQGLSRYRTTRQGPILGQRVEVMAMRADGAEFPVELAITPIPLPDGREQFTAHIRDITKRRQRESQLEAARSAATSSVKSRNMFLANVSHDLRTPLNAVIGMSHLLARTVLDEQQQEYVTGIQHSGDLLLSLVSDLIDMSRIRAGRMEFEAVPFSVGATVRQVTSSLHPVADSKGLYLRVQVDPAVPAAVSGDPLRLSQVLLNLIDNALKFTAHGGVSVAVGLVAREEQVVHLHFTVSDTGPGISPERLSAVFEPFTQETPEIARLFGGSGLGLAIVSELVEAQGGRVDVRSELARGSTFRVEIPYRIEAEELPVLEVDARTGQIRGARILVVEDNELNSIVTARVLQGAGAQVRSVETGEQALEVVRDEPFDLVVMDLQLPGSDGYETAWRIRRELGFPPAVLPIIALTASAAAAERRKVEAAGMNDLILKPCAPATLVQRISAALQRREPQPPAAPVDPDATLEVGRLDMSSAGDPAFAAELVAIFGRTVSPLLDQLDAAAAGGSSADVAALAHRVKGCAGIVGALQLERAAGAMEVRSRSGGEPTAAASRGRLRSLFDEARAALTEHLRETGSRSWMPDEQD
jgi:PAS domain S-box-containing protein